MPPGGTRGHQKEEDGEKPCGETWAGWKKHIRPKEIVKTFCDSSSQRRSRCAPIYWYACGWPSGFSPGHSLSGDASFGTSFSYPSRTSCCSSRSTAKAITLASELIPNRFRNRIICERVIGESLTVTLFSAIIPPLSGVLC